MLRGSLLIAALAAAPESVAAAITPVCLPYDNVVGILTKKHNEHPRYRYFSVTGELFEMWATPDGNGYSILRIFPDGKACLIDVGINLDVISHEAGEQL